MNSILKNNKIMQVINNYYQSISYKYKFMNKIMKKEVKKVNNKNINWYQIKLINNNMN